MKPKIFVIEDDPTIRAELLTLLQGNAYDAAAATDFTSAAIVQTVKTFQPHLILLDIKLPQTTGFALCSQLRAFSNVPIVFVTSCTSDLDELNSILLGGDAFITKPYHTAILLAKIASLLKRACPTEAQASLTWRGAALHLDSSRIEYAGRYADLTKTELKLLCHLFRHAGTICARAELIESLWDQQVYIDDNALSVNVNRIREKLTAIGLTDFIRTKHRQGYTL